MSADPNRAIRDAITTVVDGDRYLHEFVTDMAREAVLNHADFRAGKYGDDHRLSNVASYAQDAGEHIRDFFDAAVRESRWDTAQHGMRRLVSELFAVLGTDDWDRIGDLYLPDPAELPAP